MERLRSPFRKLRRRPCSLFLNFREEVHFLANDKEFFMIHIQRARLSHRENFIAQKSLRF